MLGNGEAQKEAIRPDFNRSIIIDFAGAKITSDAGFLLMREVDQRFGIIENGCKHLVDNRSASHSKHSFEQMIPRQVLACSCGVSFPAASSLPGDTWLAVLRQYTLKNVLQRSGKRGIFKIREKRNSSRFWSGMMAFWVFPKRISPLKIENLIENWQMGMRNCCFGKSAA